MRYAVYADLSCELTRQERSAVFEALDSTVPDSGCVGRQNGPNDEVYFSVEARTEEEATGLATHYMNIVLQKAAMVTEYAVTLVKIERA